MKHKRRNLTGNVPLDNLRAIPGFPGYFATEDGRFFSIGELSIHLHGDGYNRIQALHDDGVTVTRRRLGVHQAIALAFLGEPSDPNLVVCHRDGDKFNNKLSNLYWGTSKQNGEDMARHGKMKGEKNPKAKLTAADVKAIKQRLAKGEKTASIQKDYPFVTWEALKAIKSGKNWKHI